MFIELKKQLFMQKRLFVVHCFYILETIQCRNWPSNPEVAQLMLQNVPESKFDDLMMVLNR